MTLASPWYLLLLIPVIVVMWLLSHGKIGREATLLFSYIDLLKEGRVKKRTFHPFQTLRFLARFTPILLFIFALARPQRTDIEMRPVGQTTEFIICIDTSSTMQNSRMGSQSRLDAVRSVVKNFVDQRPFDRFGLVAFSKNAQTVCPVTENHAAFFAGLNDLPVDPIGISKAQGIALATALNRLRDSTAPVRVVVMLSDGPNNVSEIEPLEAAQTAWALGVNVYTVGVGAAGPMVPPVEPTLQSSSPEKARNFDERSLFQMARNTGGVYFRANDGELLKEVLHEINLLEQYQLSTERIPHHTEYFPWLAWPGLAMLMAGVLIDRILNRKLP